VRIGAANRIPAAAIGGVDRRQHCIEARSQLVALGDSEGDGVATDSGLSPYQALAHRRRRDQKGRSDALGVQAQHGLQHQRGARRRLDLRVAASKHQPQPLVGDGAVAALLADQLQGLHRRRSHAVTARRVDQLSPRDREQPCLRSVRHAGKRPGFDSGAQSIGERILGRGDIARAAHQIGEQPAIAEAGGTFGRPPAIASAVRPGHPICIKGRTSTEP
jgi:hypothetical protein